MDKLSQHSQNSFCQVYENDDQILQSIGGTSTVKKQESATLGKHQQKSGERSASKEKEFDNPALLSKQVITKGQNKQPAKPDSKGETKPGQLNWRTHNNSKFGRNSSSRLQRSAERSPASANKTLYIQDATPQSHCRGVKERPEKNGGNLESP